ncbi:MAG: hypothetical protein LKJ06_07940 [Schleiferilactobacillus harbinensis]|nr:hypothetical protein [Schleiferilactobacillus harbinensis]
MLLTIITLIFGGNTTAYIALNYLMRHSFDLVSMSVGAIGVILAAIAILVVIFSRQGLARIVAADEQTFEGFIFPYRLSATIWAILAVWSLFVPLLNNGLNISVKLAIAYVWLFLILYAMLYVLYLIGEIIQNILLSAEIESKK